MTASEPSGGQVVNYFYQDARPNPTHRYLWPSIERALSIQAFAERRAIDIGCGNGSTSEFLRQKGFRVIGVDASERGIAIAREAFRDVEFEVGDAYADLAGRFGRFPLVCALEVIEHMFDPRLFVRRLRELVTDDGVAIISTPYHGYWKDLALAVTGRWERHHNPLNLGGHIKFFGVSTLKRLLNEEGFSRVSISRTGRSIPALAMSMVAVARR